SPGRLRVLAAEAAAKDGLGRLRLQVATLQNRPADIAAEADRMLATRPAGADGWVERGDLFMLKSMPDSAPACYHRAIGRPKSLGEGPPFVLMKRRGAFMAVLDGRGALDPEEKARWRGSWRAAPPRLRPPRAPATPVSASDSGE